MDLYGNNTVIHSSHWMTLTHPLKIEKVTLKLCFVFDNTVIITSASITVLSRTFLFLNSCTSAYILYMYILNLSFINMHKGTLWKIPVNISPVMNLWWFYDYMMIRRNNLLTHTVVKIFSFWNLNISVTVTKVKFLISNSWQPAVESVWWSLIGYNFFIQAPVLKCMCKLKGCSG